MSDLFTIDEIKSLITLTDDLENECYKTPFIHNHLNVILLETKKLLTRKLSIQKKKLKDRWEYYTGKAKPEVYKENPFPLKILKTDIHLYLDSDPELSVLNEEIDDIKNEISFIEESLKNVNQRTFLIKSSMDFKRFMAGG